MRQLTPDGAEFLVLGNLLVRGIYAHKNYINTPDYDVVAINPRNKKVVKKDETPNKKIEKKKNTYSIVVGTFKYRNNAEKQIKLIKSKYPVSTKDKISNVVLIKVSGKQLYESRFENFSKKEAYTACKRLKKYNRDCFVRL